MSNQGKADNWKKCKRDGCTNSASFDGEWCSNEHAKASVFDAHRKRTQDAALLTEDIQDTRAEPVTEEHSARALADISAKVSLLTWGYGEEKARRMAGHTLLTEAYAEIDRLKSELERMEAKCQEWRGLIYNRTTQA